VAKNNDQRPELKNPDSPLRVLVISGTRFIGPFVVRELFRQGHQVVVFHRRQNHGDLPPGVERIEGDHKVLPGFKEQLALLAPHVVIHMVAFTEKDARTSMSTFKGIAQRLVVLSSMDVYRAYDPRAPRPRPR